MKIHAFFSLLAVSGILGRGEATAQTTDAAANSVHLEWNAASLTLVQPGGNYARIVRLPGGQLACAYELGAKIFLRRSLDNGQTWNALTLVAAWPAGALANPELLSLRNGSVLCFYNQRPRNGRRGGATNVAVAPPPGQPPSRYGIALSRSTDGGFTWDASTTLFQGGTDGGTGCWEPAAVEIPHGAMTGEIQLFFANEFPYPKTDEQEISLLRSLDSGRSWTPPQTASFRACSRDGMPVPTLLRDGQGVAVVIEDNGLSGIFKPSIVFSDLATNWRGGPILAESPRRWGALAAPLAPAVYAGAPYLRQMPTGETILSFQQGDNANDLHSARLAVCIGDKQARHFGTPSYPFPATPGRGQLWNSLFVKDAQTVTAVTSASINGIGGVWTMDGRLVH